MTESEFIKQNIEDWRKFEASLQSTNIDADELGRLYSKISGDLSYAQTHYPRRGIRRYLNQLLGNIFSKMSVAPKRDFIKTIAEFYTITVAGIIVHYRQSFYLSLVIFVLSVSVGIYSTLTYENFPLSILGPEYMATTETNIQNNDPMAIYKSQSSSFMFLAITLNNIKVAFLAFVMGTFSMLGTFYVLIKNGIMLGTFQTFFYTKGLLVTSFLTIWIHGTIEISSIVIAGAAGIVLGKRIVHPGTYTRSQSIKTGALHSFIILMSTVPLFVIAGFLEGYVTRYTGLPDIAKISIILCSLFLVLYMYVYLPYRFKKSGMTIFEPGKHIIHQPQVESVGSEGGVLAESLKTFRKNTIFVFFKTIVPAMMILVPVICYETLYSGFLISSSEKFYFASFPQISPVMYFGLFLTIFLFLSAQFTLTYSQEFSHKHWWDNIKKYFPVFVVSSLLVSFPFVITDEWTLFLLSITFPVLSAFFILFSIQTSQNIFSTLQKGLLFTYHHWLKVILYSILSLIMMWLMNGMISSLRMLFLDDMFFWHNLFGSHHQNLFFIEYLSKSVLMMIFISFLYALSRTLFVQINHQKYSLDIQEKVETFISSKTNKV
ncbi:MAG: stage II sporulation protein M [Saprospiraceae bacterium]|nr:stage II sporulation protein M [Saprospiraceae bacterium]